MFVRDLLRKSFDCLNAASLAFVSFLLAVACFEDMDFLGCSLLSTFPFWSLWLAVFVLIAISAKLNKLRGPSRLQVGLLAWSVASIQVACPLFLLCLCGSLRNKIFNFSFVSIVFPYCFTCNKVY